MDYTCANCKNRWTWDCEDYHWGYFDTKACKGDFELDLNTLTDEQKNMILEIARVLNSR